MTDDAISVLIPVLEDILGYPVPGVPGVRWVSPVLGTVMYAWGGRPFLAGAVSEVRSRKPGMMLLIALAITVAFVSSWGAALGLLHHELDFWWELALLIVIMLLGHWIEMRSLAQATSALDSLAALLPDEAVRVQDGPGGEVITIVRNKASRMVENAFSRRAANISAGSSTNGSATKSARLTTWLSKPQIQAAAPWCRADYRVQTCF